MKNIPKNIYLQVGNDCPSDADFSGLSGVSWCNEKIHKNDIEYVRTDIAEKMAKEFAEYIRYNTKNIGAGMYRRNKKYLTEADKVFTLDELFNEFKQQNK